MTALLNPEQIFDPITFAQQLATSSQPLPVFKRALQQGQAAITQAFQQQAPITLLVHYRSWLLDQLLIQAWQRQIPAESPLELALVAVGGYGRQELLPASDIDVLILTTPSPEKETLTTVISPFLYLLMDMGVKVGYSVRSIADCQIEATHDVTVITTLMEARYLSGSQQLFQQLGTAIAPEHCWPSAAFFRAKQQEQAARHQRFHDTAYKLEPNVKESPGGLRDIQTIGWVAKRHFNATTLHDLVTHQFLSEQEYQALMQGQQFLWRVRFVLHTLSKRHCEDRLLLDYQPQVAATLGYVQDAHLLAVEQFMQEYYRTVKQISHLNQMLLQLFEQALLPVADQQPPTILNARFQSRHQLIEARHANVFQRRPSALLEIFLLLAQQYPQLKGIRATTIRLIYQHLYLVNEAFRQDLRNRSLFMEILRQPRGITHVLRQMNHYGLLAAYLPAFANIVGRMQYDLFHIYTVDEHTLFVIRNLRRLMVPEYAHELPRCSEIAQRIPKPELLYLAGLFHDIAKGRGGDHSQLGAEEAKLFCLRHGISQNDTKLVTWLVNHHLIMSTTSQRKDIDDPAEILAFAKVVDNRTRLDYLYLLTVADIRATNPDLWDSWKAALLWKLYRSTHQVLSQGGIMIPDRARQIQETCREVCRRLADRLTVTEIDQALAEVTDDYLFHYQAAQIAWHLDRLLAVNRPLDPLVGVRQDDDGNTEIFIYSPDNPLLQKHRFALVTTLLDQLGLNIVDAQLIQFKPGFIIDTYVVSHPLQPEKREKPVSTQPIHAEPILKALNQALAQPDHLPPLPQHWQKRTTRIFNRPAVITCTSQTLYTILELQATDRAGLLAQVARAFLNHGVQVLNAKVVTLGSRAEDSFYITNAQHQPLSPAQCDTLQQALQQALA